MNWDSVEGQWKQRRGKAVRHWGKMMNDELAAIAGKYEELVGRLQEKYGIAKEEAGQQVSRYRQTVEQLKRSNGKLVDLQKSMIRKVKSDLDRKVKSDRDRKAKSDRDRKAKSVRDRKAKSDRAGKMKSRRKTQSHRGSNASQS